MAAGAALAAMAAVQAAAAGPASAAGPWSKQDTAAAGLMGIDCASQTTCRAVGLNGLVRATDDAGIHWRSQDSRTTAQLAAISCDGEPACVAVGELGTVLTTADGGLTWIRRASGTLINLTGVSCPTAATCYAVGEEGTILKTTDGGQRWTVQVAQTSEDLYGVSCATPATCMAVGWNGSITTTNGGLAWARKPTPSGANFIAVSCPTAASCYVAGSGGTVLRSTDLGATWTRGGSTGTTAILLGISCPSAGHCVAVSEAGAIVETLTAGMAWAREPSPPAGRLRAVSCPDDTACWAAQHLPSGATYTNSAGGTANSGEQAAQAVAGQAVPTGAASDDCTAPDATIVDGYFGSLYARLRVQQEGTESWVCTRLQYESGELIAGGKVTAVDGTTVTRDGAYGACSAQPGNSIPGGHPQAAGSVGEPGDPYHVPYLLDTYTDTREAWLCLRAGVVGERLAFNGAAVFERDDVSVASPPRAPWRAGQPSTQCESQTSGGRTRLVNAVVSNAHVWITAWQSGSRVELCFRAEGAGSGGGRLTLDSSASPGVTPVLQPAFDTTGCTRTAFQDTANGVALRHSPAGGMPASVCLSVGGATVRFTAGVSGSPSVPPVVGLQRDA